MQQLDLGTATIESGTPVVAGSYTTIRYTYTAGHPVDDSGYVKIVFRFAGDFGQPQFADPAAPNYCRVHTTGDCRIEPRWDPKGHTRPWGHAIYFRVRGGFLDRGQEIEVVFGDRSAGSPGWRMQTFCEETFEFKTLVDPIATYEFKELPESPTLSIVPGEPARAVCIAPSQAVAGRSFTYYLKLEDRWGNPTGVPRARTHPGFECSAGERRQVRTLAARDAVTGLSAQSNPIDVLAAEPLLRGYWADLHGQSEETIGSNSIDDYYTFARDLALLDLAAHQGNDFQVTDSLWETVNDTARAFNEPERFVTFPGYEWSGNTPLGGDRNVYFAGEGGSIVHSCADLLPGKRSAYATASTAAELFEALARQSGGPQPFVFAHVGGRYADMSMHDPDIELAVEVHSAWGTFEWLVDDALQRGYRIGICANSDGHKGRPGASYPGAGKFGSYGGLTCVLAPRLDRKRVLGALQARHFYATTGQRCLLEVRLELGGSPWAMMGDVIPVPGDALQIRVRVVGTAPIERVEVRNGLEVVRTVRPYTEADLGRRVKVVWSGAEVRGRARASTWDGHLSVKDNAILDVRPVNFWNPDQQPELRGDRVAWRSVTTGGPSGLILTLREPHAGSLSLATAQQEVECALAEVGLEPRVWDCGGLRKRIDVYRLADPPPAHAFSFSLPVPQLREGDNPIYVKVVQEDGHMAWTSPMYLVK